jgi:hypothetical protein
MDENLIVRDLQNSKVQLIAGRNPVIFSSEKSLKEKLLLLLIIVIVATCVRMVRVWNGVIGAVPYIVLCQL